MKVENSDLWWLPLERPAIGNHIVQTYDDPEFLAEAVAVYIDSGLRLNESVVLIGVPSHLTIFEKRLAASGWDVAGLKEKGQLISINGNWLLSLCATGSRLNAAAMQEAVVRILEDARCGGAYAKVRVFGEMVDVLYHQGQDQAAIRLERVWNDLLQTEPVSLFCAYRLDPLSKSVYSGFLQEVCRQHSTFIPVRDYPGFETAVERAVQEVVDPALRGKFDVFSARRQESMPEMPKAQSVLFWLKEHMPATWSRVLGRASSHYSSKKTAGGPLQRSG